MFCGPETVDVSRGEAEMAIPVSHWLRTYHVMVEKFHCLPGNVAKRWTLLLIHR